MQTVVAPRIEVRADLSSQSEWDRWRAHNPATDNDIAALVRHVGRFGLIDPIEGKVPASDVQIVGPNYRESLYARGCQSRLRAVTYLLKQLRADRGRALDVYAPESVTPLADILRKMFARFVGSEYLPGEARAKHPNVRHEDIQALTFPDASFDLYVSCEVLEHIPDVDAALREARRILRPKGVFMGTVPFRPDRKTALIRAKLESGTIKHLLEPEIHGNPVDHSGSLVFEVPGWDLLTRLRAAGFKGAKMIFLMSTTMGIVAPSTGGVFCFHVTAPS